MKKFCASLVVMTLVMMPLSTHAGMVGTPDPVERNLIENQRLQQEMMKDLNKPTESTPPASKIETPGTNWWPWALSVAIIGGVVAAAGNGNKDKGDNGGGTVVVTY